MELLFIDEGFGELYGHPAHLPWTCFGNGCRLQGVNIGAYFPRGGDDWGTEYPRAGAGGEDRKRKKQGAGDGTNIRIGLHYR